MAANGEANVFEQEIELVRVGSDVARPELGRPHPKRRPKLTVLLAAVPLVLSTFYFSVLAANRFESEATFVVRSPSGNAVSQIANLVQGSGIISSTDDAYIVQEYVLSRDAMHDLIAADNLMSVFARSGWDPLWAVPGVFGRSTDERLYGHYQKFISVSIDKTTGIGTLKVQAFEPRDAQRIAVALLKKSEILLNRLNERAQKDAVVSAQRQVEDNRQRAYATQKKVTEFRNRESVIDPTLLSTSVIETVTRLSLEMAELNAQLSELVSSSPQNPQIATIKFRLAALESQIAKERSQLAGTDTSLAPRIAEYERLVLEREFAERAFVSALNTLEIAKIDAERQRTFLEQITKPNLPDYPKFPYRLLWIFAFGLTSIAIYWIVQNLVIDTLAHAET